VFIFPFIMNTFLIPARIVLGFFLIVDNLPGGLCPRGDDVKEPRFGADAGGAGGWIRAVSRRAGIVQAADADGTGAPFRYQLTVSTEPLVVIRW